MVSLAAPDGNFQQKITLHGNEVVSKEIVILPVAKAVFLRYIEHLRAVPGLGAEGVVRMQINQVSGRPGADLLQSDGRQVDRGDGGIVR